jgi:PleD family two-component response regulator
MASKARLTYLEIFFISGVFTIDNWRGGTMPMSLLSSVQNKCNQKVLLFCDDTGSRECLQRFLAGQGFDITSVDNQREFSDEVSATPYDVALLGSLCSQQGVDCA